MKQFAFPISVKCADIKERNECIKLLDSIGYKCDNLYDNEALVCTNRSGINNLCTSYTNPYRDIQYKYGRHYIDHFNPELIRDIASACTNETWQEKEPVFVWDKYNNDFHYEEAMGLAGELLSDFKSRRPTLAEICEHHGYYIDGKDIKRKEQKCKHDCSNCKNFEPKESEYFVTDDGVRLKAGDTYYYVSKYYVISADKCFKPFKDCSQLTIGRFSTREAAEAWVAENKPFEPVTITLTCDTPEELRWLYFRMNAPISHVEQHIAKNHKEYNYYDLKHFRVVSEACEMAGVKIYKD